METHLTINVIAAQAGAKTVIPAQTGAKTVIPAKAGIQGSPRRRKLWVPAFAGMTQGVTCAGMTK